VFVIVVAGLVVGAILQWRARRLRGFDHDRAVDTIEAWFLVWAMCLFAAVLWVAACRLH